MYTKLSKKARKKVDKVDEEFFEQLSEDSLNIYKRLDEKFKDNLDRSLSKLKGSIFYIQKGPYGFTHQEDPNIERWQDTFIELEKKELNDTDLQHVFFTSDYKDEFDDNYNFGNFTINRKYVVYWNNREVFYSRLKDTKNNNDLIKMTKINFVVDPYNKDTFVKRVRTGSNPD